MKHVSILLLTLFCTLCLHAQDNLIPKPKEIIVKNTKLTKITSVDAVVSRSYKLPDEGYTLEIKGSKAILRAKTPQGLVWARATLKQLKDNEGRAPQVRIKDYPSFKIRGFMNDTGRNFRPVDMIKKELALFSDYKINVFHWHLTDRPAWRIECRAYPKLNDPQYQRPGRDVGKFYTYNEIRDVIAYAKNLGIMIIPEIDMPGHSTYFDAAFGFSMASPEGMKVLEDCLKEFFKEIPAKDCPYFHIGSDEVHVADPKGFMTFCEKLAHDNGRTPICWNPGLPPSEGTIHQIWNYQLGIDIDKNRGYDSPYLDSYMGYLNHANAVLNTSRFFMHTICGVEEGNDKALGGILCLWNDVRVGDKTKLFAHNGLPNCLLAFAERTWCGGRFYDNETAQLLPSPDEPMYKELTDFERRLSYHRDHLLYDWDMRWSANAALKWNVTLPQRRGADPSTMIWKPAYGGTVNVMALCKKYDVEVLPAMDAWAETEINVAHDSTMLAMVGFESPARSNRMSDGIGEQGYWESEGRLFVNDQEIFPPVPWKEPGKYKAHYATWGTPMAEEPYTDEQLFWMRQPAVIPLKAGRNVIRMYCPRVFNHNEWIFSFIPIAIDQNGHITSK